MEFTAKRATVYIDAEIPIYRAAAANNDHIEWSPGKPEFAGDPVKARRQLVEGIEDIGRELAALGIAARLRVCLSDRTRPIFRNRINPDYKANRTGPRPVLLPELTEAVRNAYPCAVLPHLEADDTLSIQARLDPSAIVYSADKDLLQVAGWHYHTRDRRLHFVTERDAARHFYMQTLVGDTADNYPGCPGIGPKRAAAALEGLTQPAELWAAVVATFAAKLKLSPADAQAAALHQARQAYILQPGDYCMQSKRPILWRPPAAAR